MEKTWTPSQLNAIETPNKTLVVSAGAGSGKTTVLIERIMRRILSGADIDEFLIVTYTKAAANDMREKLYKALNKALVDTDNKHLREQQYKLNSARISTIHSFCFELIKKNFAVMNISPTVRIADEAEANVLKQNCIEEFADCCYDEESEYFTVLADNFGKEKNDNDVLEKIITVYDRVRVFEDYNEWLDRAVDFYTGELDILEKDGFFSTYCGKLIKKQIENEKKIVTNMALSLLQQLKLITENFDEKSKTKTLAPAIELYEALNDISIPNEYADAYDRFNIKTKSFCYTELNIEDVEKIKKCRTAISTRLTKLKKNYFGYGDYIKDDYIRSKEIVRAFGKSIKRFDEMYTEEKRRRGILDFSDIEQMTFTLLYEKTPDGSYIESVQAKKLKDLFSEIYIDEYQDVNPIQDAIFKALARNDNRFMVGDVKQSIYKFRNAYPEIFINYINSFGDLYTGNENARIFLRENFRCAEPIINFVNIIFDKIYTLDNVGSDYSREALVFKKPDCTVTERVTLALFNRNYKDEDLNEPEETEDDTEGDNDEACFVAAEIKKLMREYVKEDGSRLKYGDIAIIARTLKNYAVIYEQQLNKAGIPTSSKPESFLDSPEILLCLASLRAIDNPTDDISLTALMRSPIFNFSADELYHIRLYSEGCSMYDSTRLAASDGFRIKFGRTGNRRFILKSAQRERGNMGVTHSARAKRIRVERRGKSDIIDLQLSLKCLEFLRELSYYRRRRLELQSHKLIWLFIQRSNLSAIAAAEENGSHRVDNLLTLYNFARRFEKTSFKGLGSFLAYINEIIASEKKLEEFAEENDNAVRIISIHSSKGLEYPVCFVVGMGKQFNFKDIQAPLILRRESSLFFSLKENMLATSRDTLQRKAASFSERRDMLAEELRKMYVAFTRAQELLYITASYKKEFDYKNFMFDNAVMPLEFILFALNGSEEEAKKAVDILDFDKGFGMTQETAIIITEPTVEKTVYEYQEETGIAQALEYKYPNTDSAVIPAKLSVSELRPGLFEDDGYRHQMKKNYTPARPAFVSDSAVGPAQRGTANHLFMQFADFDNAAANGVQAEAKRLVEKCMLDNDEYNMLWFEHLERFFKSPLYLRMSQSKKMYREKRFVFEKIIKKPWGDEQVIIHGVVDCFFENQDGSYTVVDYKTDVLPANGGETILTERHRAQLGYYVEAVEKCTGCSVKESILYSLYLDKSITV